MKRSQIKTVNRITSSIISTLITVLLCIAVVLLLYKGMTASYEFGYSIFNEQAVDPNGGELIEYTVENGADIFDIAQDLEEIGLINDAKVMIVQKILYQYTIYPGTYSLSTSMTPKDILDRIGAEPTSTSDDED